MQGSGIPWGNENRETENCRVGPYGNSNEKQTKSLRKKINEHSVSQSHKLAQDIVKRQNEEALKSSFLKTQKYILASTHNVFRTAYYFAKNNRPYSDNPGLIEL
ncbi:hypothetical protein F7725_015285 [Dissostichus mawsoni]|uniref:Uncharacterized protein n=1 Tax=Dissostichus mawsoni TaxID=36200 RepID=A0A7J5YKG5_DISMA|nr:hypothetical protein F7725_015285 [Dissostichus mawsoni]